MIENDQYGEYSANFSSLNRNKRSVAIDFHNKEELMVLKELCLQADVVVLENFSPGVLEKFGLHFEGLSKEHESLVYCSISGYGQEGPYAKKGAFDVTIQAFSGLMSVTGRRRWTSCQMWSSRCRLYCRLICCLFDSCICSKG